MTVVRVALPVPLPQLFDYKLEDFSPDDVGRCVRVPFGVGEQRGLIVSATAEGSWDPSRLRSVRHVERGGPPMPEDWLALVNFAAHYYHAPLGEVVAMALPPVGGRPGVAKLADPDPWLELSRDGEVALGQPPRAPRAIAALVEAGHRVPCRRRALADAFGSRVVADLLRRGWLQATPVSPVAQVTGEPSLTPAQAAAVGAIETSRGGFQPWLLLGVTGSGKTEVYLRLARSVLAAGGQVLMLVPEIALTPQLEARVAGRFPCARVVSLHSAQADGARASGFALALTGVADIVLGTRLALFTPLPRLGLIIVDEEHDPSYKQQEGVRYSARDLAVWRARQRGVPVVLGSATPSAESWLHAQAGRYRLVELADRAVAAALPTVRRVDLRRQVLQEGLSPPLVDALAARLAAGEQSLVFLNRRGYAPVLSCPACGWASGCPQCSAHMVVHLVDRRLRCHHCGLDQEIPRACPDCGNQDLQPFGRGTQRLEARLAELFPQARILRVDRDAVRTRAHWGEVLAAIEAREVDILVGTQMLAKGHDFPSLTLVAVVGADASLFSADFRASERLLQQLMQVGGRAGRGQRPGEVWIQTAYPEHPLYAHLARHDYPGYMAEILAERRQARFPPFSFQAMLRADAPLLETAMDFLGQAAALAAREPIAPVRLFDPVPMRLTRLARRERAQLLVEAPERPALQAFLTRWVADLYAQRPHRALRWHIDVDPLEV
ncbi:MAG: primosomal protein N' [Zoogloeaceae bacterium]|nr:primosomal protein N' [Zoogloeaceae bacterium]